MSLQLKELNNMYRNHLYFFYVNWFIASGYRTLTYSYAHI